MKQADNNDSLFLVYLNDDKEPCVLLIDPGQIVKTLVCLHHIGKLVAAGYLTWERVNGDGWGARAFYAAEYLSTLTARQIPAAKTYYNPQFVQNGASHSACIFEYDHMLYSMSPEFCRRLLELMTRTYNGLVSGDLCADRLKAKQPLTLEIMAELDYLAEAVRKRVFLVYTPPLTRTTMRRPDKINTMDRSVAYEWKTGPTGDGSWGPEPRIGWVYLQVLHDRKQYFVTLASFAKQGSTVSFTAGGGVHVLSIPGNRFNAKTLQATLVDALARLPELIAALDASRQEKALQLLAQIDPVTPA